MGLSEFLRKTFAEQKSRAGEAGQAVLEYVLVLLVVVSILLGFLYQFNDAFKTYLDTFFGDYIACLLETGELPALGGDGPSSGECNMPDMNVAGGAMLDNAAANSAANGSNGGGDGSSSSDSASSGSGSGSSRGGSNRRRRPSRFNSGGGTGNGEAVGSAANRSRPGRITKRTRVKGSAGNGGGFSADSSEGGSGGRRGRVTRRKRVIYLGDDYLSKNEKRKNQDPVIGSVKNANKKEGEGSLRKTRMKLDLPEREVARIEEEKVSLGFGVILKFLIIGGILIALFVFLGGQAMSIKKGWQKGE